MNGKDYEKRCADYLRAHGYTHIRLTGNSGDYGVDIVASKRRHRYAVQCKFYSRPVGVAAVQQVVGGMAYYGCDRALVITNSTFTKQARELAMSNEVELLDNVRRAGNSRLLMILFTAAVMLLLMFTEYRTYALAAAGVAAVIALFVLYLRRRAIREIREYNTEYNPHP